jgi:hypothetical protein
VAQDRVDHLAARLGAVVLAAIRTAEFSFLLRSGKCVDRNWFVDGKSADFLVGSFGLLLFQTIYTVDLAGAVLTGHHIVGGTEYMFDPLLPLFIRLLSLFHVVTPPLLLWAIRRLGYDRRGWKLQTLMAWIVVPVNYFWRPQQDVNWARGLFFHQQQGMPAWAYPLVYLVTVPLLVYFPTHLFLDWLTRRWQR